ncbi:Protein of uncharacterised function (DUF3521) [Shigella flexneri]|nr:Protein of uncharacterised function (DUF3521) [Shigella flexneri]
MIINEKLPDALRLSGLHGDCNILNLQDFVGLRRCSCRIQHEQRAHCQQITVSLMRKPGNVRRCRELYL